MNHTTHKFFNAEILVILFAFFFLLPFIILSFYIQPSADDFCFSFNAQRLGIWEAQKERYLTWTGRYFSSFLMSINPLVYNSFFLYKLIPISLIILLVLSFYWLTSVLFQSFSKIQKGALISLFIITYFYQMPSVAEGFYWLAGSISYQIANIFSLLLLVFLIKLLKTRKNIYFLLCSALIVLIVGSNETSMLLICFLVSFLFLYLLIINKKVDFFVLSLLIVCIFSSMIVIASSGNYLRSEYFPLKHQFILSTKKTVISTINYLIKWLPIVVLLSILLFDYISKRQFLLTSKVFGLSPGIVAGFLVIILLIGFFPSYWSMGKGPPPRTINVIYFYFLLGFLLLMFNTYLLFKKQNFDFIKISPFTRKMISLLLIILFLKSNNIRTAYIDWFSGTAASYHAQIEERFRLISSSSDRDTIVLPALRERPTTIYFDDLGTAADDWRNQCLYLYLNSPPIKIEQ